MDLGNVPNLEVHDKIHDFGFFLKNLHLEIENPSGFWLVSSGQFYMDQG